MTTTTRLKELIQQTHEHGLILRTQLIDLDKAGKAKSLEAKRKRMLLRWLEWLNRKRWAELHAQEHPSPPKHKFTMYDAIEFRTAGIPVEHPEAIAGYVDGKWPSYDEGCKRYPNAKHYSIAVSAKARARFLDIEQGDANPDEAVNWFRNFSEGKPGFYCSESRMVEVEHALLLAGIKRWQYLIWSAHYAGKGAFIDYGADGTQYESVESHNHNYDVSLCEPWF